MTSTVAIGGNIVVDESLVLYLDAANPDSYSGTGATWYDITTPQNNATLVNSPTFFSTPPANIYFNNSGSPVVNKYADFSATLGNTNTVTIEMWVNIVNKDTNATFPVLAGWNTYMFLLYPGAGLGFGTGNGEVYGISDTPGSSTVENLGLIGNWSHYTVVMCSGSLSNTNQKLYINGNLQTLSYAGGTEISTNRTFNNGDGRIAGWRLINYHPNARYSIFKIYNRALTQAEVTQNFNALKSRFGIF